jgi:enoyl-CoA hydratase/carnithine racemase
VDHGPLHTTIDDGIATVVIDHPPTNLVDGAVIGGLIGLLDALEPDESVRVVVFTSADPDFFLMHGDVQAILAVPEHPHVPVTEPNIAAATFQRLSVSRLISIGVIDGAARGGGCEFASALDFRFGTPRALVGQPEVAMGILPGAGGTARWPRIVGRSRALEIILTGRDVPADELLALGWLHAVVPGEDVASAAHHLARRVARLPVQSVVAVKRVVETSLAGLDAALVAESDELDRLLAAGAHHRPMQRFLDAGGQTREGERPGIASLLDAMLEG